MRINVVKERAKQWAKGGGGAVVRLATPLTAAVERRSEIGALGVVTLGALGGNLVGGAAGGAWGCIETVGRSVGWLGIQAGKACGIGGRARAQIPANSPAIATREGDIELAEGVNSPAPAAQQVTAEPAQQVTSITGAARSSRGAPETGYNFEPGSSVKVPIIKGLEKKTADPAGQQFSSSVTRESSSGSATSKPQKATSVSDSLTTTQPVVPTTSLRPSPAVRSSQSTAAPTGSAYGGGLSIPQIGGMMQPLSQQQEEGRGRGGGALKRPV